jgi:hypothetical protein
LTIAQVLLVIRTVGIARARAKLALANVGTVRNFVCGRAVNIVRPWPG